METAKMLTDKPGEAKVKRMEEKVMTKKEKQEGSQIKYALAAFMSVLVFVIIYKYALNMLAADSLNDLREHTLHAESIYLDKLWPAWLKRPYLFWHLCVKGCIKFFDMPVNAASACTHGFFAGLTCLVTFYLLDKTCTRLTGKDIGVPAALVAGILVFVQPLYVPWFNAYQYEGQFSINPIFNPTHMAVRPFGLLCFMLAVDLILAYKGKEILYFPSIRNTRWLYILFSLILLLSAFTKPTFMYMLLPAGVVYLLIDLGFALKKRDGSAGKVWSFMWRIGCASIPAMLYLLLEYVAFYFWGGTNEDASLAIYPFLTAWHLFSSDVPRSLRLSMAFPFWMTVTNLRYFFQSEEGRLSLIGYTVGTLEFAFIVEAGEKLSHLNFAWPMMSGMLLIWVVSGARLVALTAKSHSRRWDLVVITVGWILLAIHLFSGLYYINPYQYII